MILSRQHTEPDVLATLRAMHSPMTGTLQAVPGGKEWCRQCQVRRHPCPTRRLVDGEDVHPDEIGGQEG